MTAQERAYFAALASIRSSAANLLDEPFMGGVKSSVTDKYSDRAHFVYELLQNADDAKATKARFRLESDKLIFAHNGTRHFSVSDPKTEAEDAAAGCLGDVNAITSIGHSNKPEDSIGRFGLGFKSVFLYTSTPHIYGPEFCFRIERLFVPGLLDSDFPERRGNETLFVFPFDHPERDAAEAYADISDKLRNLSFPLLFLSNLKEIEFEFGNIIGLYEKNVRHTITYDNTIAEQICLTQNAGDELFDENLWCFSRRDAMDRRYAVGFFLDESGYLKAVDEPAFCFFPTKETTDLNFAIHAPFILNDNREGIRTGMEHNSQMIQLLADLAADSLEYLRDIGEKTGSRLLNDNILSLIPIDPNKLTKKNQISFLPFYDAIKAKLKTAELLPTMEGYVSSENAYWAEAIELPQLFSDKQLANIVGNENAHWVFTTIEPGKIQHYNVALYTYIGSLVRTNIDENHIICGHAGGLEVIRGDWVSLEKINGIRTSFIEQQSIDWLHNLYKWLSASPKRAKLAKTVPVFLDQDGRAAAAFDGKRHLILFLPNADIPNCRTVHPDLLQNPDAMELIQMIGITEPSIRDEIYHVIIPQYKANQAVDADAHFRLFFKYYRQCPQEEINSYIAEIRDCAFVHYSTQSNPSIVCAKASDLYMPTEELRVYFCAKPDTKFVTYDEYLVMFGAAAEEHLIAFLSKLGVMQSVLVRPRTIEAIEQQSRRDLPKPRSTSTHRYTEGHIDGCRELLNTIISDKSLEKSIVLWNQLLKIAATCGYGGLARKLQGTCSYYYRTSKLAHFPSSIEKSLRAAAWLQNSDGVFVSSSALTISTLCNVYDLSDEHAADLLTFLGIKDDRKPAEDNSNLTDEQREQIAFAKKMRELGIESEADLADFQEFRRKKAAQQQAQQSHNGSQEHTADAGSEPIESLQDADGAEPPATQEQARRRAVLKDIAQRTQQGLPGSHAPAMDEEEYADEDEWMPSPVDYSKKIERAKEKSAAEVNRIAHYEELYNKAVQLTKEGKYTFAWFKALLELESIQSGEANANSREISISFAKVAREPGTQRTLILKHPSRYIPQYMEDLADIPLVLHMGEQKKTVAIEVANIKSYTLRVKLKNGADIDGIDLNTVTAATIDAKSPVFLLEELRKQFGALDYADDFNMKDNLCENIEFVFGPPGTGKTTHLARNVLIPMMRDNPDCRVLVLTPTNKAADVLTKRIMEEFGRDESYADWLVRFGGTGDEEIEQSPVFHDKTFDIRTLRKNVTVTTIARFPYDFFMPQGSRVFLHGMNWDYIVIDEASMIPIANIVFPLYKKTPKKFIIAGDPFQIEPITAVDLWKDESIYKLVELNSFTNPTTKPHPYKVELLTTQYRSIPAIGGIFSHFAYGGILKHHRPAHSQCQLNIGDEFGIEALNILKYPVSKYESIYRPKRLQHRSAYQVYSALFTFEYVCYLSRTIAASNPGSSFKIGIIAPYRAQADMIDRLLASEQLPPEIDVQVGTIHGFQGDECDIIFAVFNTPPTISGSKDMFLNKRNIINVSISRARDYLFIIMPDDDTEGIGNLKLIKRVEGLIRNAEEWSEFMTPELEELMFGDPMYLENNAFSTSHQSVNVYGLPERRYEVRTEDAAVDVQIHRAASAVVPAAIPQSAKEVKSNSSVERVYSPQYGEGEIVKRTASGKMTLATVRYSSGEKTYDEEAAIKNKTLVRI